MGDARALHKQLEPGKHETPLNVLTYYLLLIMCFVVIKSKERNRM